MTRKPSASEGPPALTSSADPNRFERRSVLGEGGAGTVHLAFDHLVLRAVAMKTLRQGSSEPERRVQQFIEEARITGQLEHPNIVPVYDFNTGSDCVAPTVIMRYVNGETYSRLIERLHASRTHAELQEALQVFLKICDAISFAHERGVIHCDLKPENVMVGQHGQVYVMDWGLARLREGDCVLPRGTGPDDPIRSGPELKHSRFGGTLGYMSPEQLRGDRSAINATTDIYGLGGILCALLTGRPPRPEVPSELADWATTPNIEDRRALPEVPPELCRITERALSPAQADRFQSVDDLKCEMDAFMAGGGWFATRRYLAGDVIVREGDSGSEAFIITSGMCDVFRAEPDGGRRLIRRMGPGETFGELSVLTGKPRSATVVARTEVTLRLVTLDALDRELARNPILASFMSAVTTRFCDLEARLNTSQD